MPSETDKLYHELTGRWPTKPDVPLPSQSLYEDTHGVSPLMQGRNPSRLLMVVLPFIVLFWGGAILVAMLVFRR